MSARETMLANIAKQLQKSSDVEQRQADMQAYLKNNRRAKTPSRVESSDLLPIFIAEAERANASCEIIKQKDIAKATHAYLQKHNIKRKIWVSKQSLIADINWHGFDNIEIIDEFDGKDDLTSLNLAYAGIAETGSLVFLSAKDLGMAQNFLSATHIAIIPQSCVVASYEDVYQRMQNEQLSPRSLTMITGPSRTGDIAQTIEIGAHAALRLHILITTLP